MKKHLLYFTILLYGACSFAQTPPEASGINCNDNSFETTAYSGERICFTICTSDADENDEVTIEASYTIPGATFDVLNKGEEHERGRFCWTPPENSHVNSPYYVRFTVRDSKGLTNTSTVKITILEIAKISIEFSETSCGEGILAIEEQSNYQVRNIGVQGKSYPFTPGVTNYVKIQGLQAGENTIQVATITSRGYNPSFYKKVTLSGGRVFNADEMERFQCEDKTILVPVYHALYEKTEFVWDDGNTSRYRPFDIKNDSVAYVYGQNGRCRDTLKVFLNVAKIDAGFSASPGIGNVPLAVSFKNESAEDADVFYWEFGDGGFSREKHPTHTFTDEGDYSVTLESRRKGLSCKSTLFLENYINAFPVGLQAPLSEKKFSVYPNPGREFIYATTEDLDIQEAYLMDLRGKVFQIPFEQFDTQIRFDIETLDIGSYIVVLQTTEGLYQETFVVGP